MWIRILDLSCKTMKPDFRSVLQNSGSGSQICHVEKMDTDPRSVMQKKWIRILDLTCRKNGSGSQICHIEKMDTDPRSVMQKKWIRILDLTCRKNGSVSQICHIEKQTRILDLYVEKWTRTLDLSCRKIDPDPRSVMQKNGFGSSLSIFL